MDTYRLDGNGILKIINFNRYRYIVLASNIFMSTGNKLTFYHRVKENGDLISLHNGNRFNTECYNNDLQHLISNFMNINTECILFENTTEFIAWIKEQPGLKNGVFYRKNIMMVD
ncbi:MAG: hypothetical protein WC929_00475 [Bacilli bacterium]